MGVLPEWSDPDRREAALERCLLAAASFEQAAGRTVLTARERYALQAAAAGLTRAESAEVLGVTEEVLNGTLRRARTLLAAKTTAQAVAIAFRQGLLH